jgi:hypothetical protein
VQFSIGQVEVATLSSLVEAKFSYEYTELSTEPEVLLAILVNSTQQLQHALDTDRNHGGYSNLDLYRLATILGRPECCELLLENRLPVTGRQSILLGENSLLDLSATSGSVLTVRFWLKAMVKATADELSNIGKLGRAMRYLVHDEYEHEKTMYMALLGNLTWQRTELKALADFHAVQLDCHVDDSRLLDAHADCAIRRLDDDCIHVPYHLRLNAEPIYQSLKDFSASHLELAYVGGFRDLTAASFSRDYNESITALLNFVTDSRFHYQSLTTGLWMVSKGFSLVECWPKSDITVGHCLGWACGRTWYAVNEDNRPDLALLMLQTGTDGCLCACSSSGCAFVSCLLKGFESGREIRGWGNGEIIRDHLNIVSLASQKANSRGIISNFIRACAFSKLEIRHTCCDIKRIHHGGEPDLSKSPTPRYQTRELQRIQKEDAYLVDILEKVVPELDAEYDNFQGDFTAFAVEHLYPRMDNVLKELKRQDREMYAQGRRELGVVMEIGSEDEEEDEEVEEIESVEESSDEDDF